MGKAKGYGVSRNVISILVSLRRFVLVFNFLDFHVSVGKVLKGSGDAWFILLSLAFLVVRVARRLATGATTAGHVLIHISLVISIFVSELSICFLAVLIIVIFFSVSLAIRVLMFQW